MSATLSAHAAWRQYTGSVAWRTVGLFAVAFTAVCLTTAAALVGGLSPWIAGPLNAVFIYCLFTPAHEAAHGNIKGRNLQYRWLENLVGWGSTLWLTAPFPMFKRLHLTHHQHTNDPEVDPDYWASGPWYLLIFKLTTIIADYHYHYWRYTFTLLSRPDTRKEFFTSLFGIILIYGAGAAWWVFFGGASLLFVWILPAVAATTVLAFAFDYLPHRPHDKRERYTNTRILLGGKVWDALFFKQNYHLIHHLYPNVPYFHYDDVYHNVHEELVEKKAQIEQVI
ncbi:MAG: fatty acid desaturase [Saprospiraceae bacterium]